MSNEIKEILKKKNEVMKAALIKASSFDIYRFPAIVKETINCALREISNIDCDYKLKEDRK